MSKNDEEVPVGRIPGISYFLSLPAEIFLSLAKTRNFSATAAQFGLSQSSVSRRITELEEEIGAALINRTHRPIALTEEGRLLEEGLRGRAQGLPELVHQIRGISRRKPALRLGVVDSLCSTLGVELIRRLSAETSSITCLTGTNDRLLEKGVSGQIDLLIASEALSQAVDIHRNVLFEEPSVLVMSKKMASELDWRQPNWTALRFCGRPYMRYYRETGGGKLSTEYLTSHGIELVGSLQADTSTILFPLIAGDAGWTIARPTALLKNRWILPELAVLPMPTPTMLREVFVLSRKSFPLLLHERVFSLSRDIFTQTLEPQLKTLVPWFRDCFEEVDLRWK
ncbi:LysR family transcriptional regulator [Mesosutterella sp. OilRF-GAM-744-9]|uniref:LysR family transcriptional regulator n=1 Tax=Mesosutterella porci TaxID=2915351 RepID=A0ABS9MPW7_9BURK|nr:LysR family transcriptional regulator [Mesosutterella sp. oilRF-744-WT-GAM-9]MCG5030442.1 LysR family transcriptional regulator [Mesosutterella sp. oilRF-744-WT-GAM-9]